MNFKNLLLRGDLTFFACLAVVVVLPVYVFFLPPFMILWVIFWLVENNFRVEKALFNKNPATALFKLFIVFFLWQIFGLFMTDSFGSGMSIKVNKGYH